MWQQINIGHCHRYAIVIYWLTDCSQEGNYRAIHWCIPSVYDLLTCKFWFGSYYFPRKGSGSQVFLPLSHTSHTPSAGLLGMFTVTQNMMETTIIRFVKLVKTLFETPLNSNLNMNTPLCVMLFACDGFLWFTFAGNRQHGRLHEVDIRTSYKHYEHPRALNNTSFSHAHIYTLMNHSAWRRVFIRFISLYRRQTYCTRVNKTEGIEGVRQCALLQGRRT